MFHSCELTDDCLFFEAKPRMSAITESNGAVGVTYFSEVIGSVRNHKDGNFDYDFEINGNLPNGIRYEACDNLFKLYGAPTQSGVFTFEVVMSISQEDNVSNGDGTDSDDICPFNVQESKSFSITIRSNESS